MDNKTYFDVDDFLLTSVPTNQSLKEDEYRRGLKVLDKLTAGSNEYRRVNAKIDRILRAIDK